MDGAFLSKIANEARGLAIDAVEKASSGHLGLPLGCAEIGAVLFADNLDYFPEDPHWLNRDRFILSAGHGSLFLYTWLHLSGYDLSLKEIEGFRSLGSRTPGHPEFGKTPGVEATTGPLGQGIGNAVGYAISGKRISALIGEPNLFTSHVICLAGDGCLQEGVARESIAFAGHLGLDNLILIYDSNDVTLDEMASITQSENQKKYFESLGWEVFEADGHHLSEFSESLKQAKKSDNQKPKVIIAKTLIGKGIAEVEGSQKAHGESGAKFAEEGRRRLGLPESRFFVSEETRKFFCERKQHLREKYEVWMLAFQKWERENPEKAICLERNRASFLSLLEKIPEFPEKEGATRSFCGEFLNTLTKSMPSLLSGSADLFGSTKNYLKEGGDFSAENPLGRNIWFGIREHAMGAICNGIAYDGIFQICQATFLVFADYLRPSIRLGALANLPSVYLFTHDSVGAGEDGPTHQPVETVSSLRLIPNLNVIRPADSEETVGALALALSSENTPSALILTRQKVGVLRGDSSFSQRRRGVARGGYILRKEKKNLKGIFLATGSEVQIALKATEEMGEEYRLVSLPCLEIFDEQDENYREEVLPPSCFARVAVEAGVSDLWWKYLGERGKMASINSFGFSAPGEEVFEKFGINVQSLISKMSQINSLYE